MSFQGLSSYTTSSEQDLADFCLNCCRETAVLAQLLYYGLTTGAGVQTLGEEYCDILQVTGMYSIMHDGHDSATVHMLDACC